ncbi:MAG TPA: DUF262 domain-containing protein [Candidatus Nitrosotenuis sp.]|nr:DUF262 domain-containing protein [Candidatus Nitrosotenuis sp.]
MTSASSNRTIRADARTLRDLLAHRRYSIDYYQREYKWQTKQVQELIEDLTGKFEDHHREGNERRAVKNYGQYFLGAIILSEKNGIRYLIDGQQRLTTLTLLLIFLFHRLRNAEEKGQIADLIFSLHYGERSFNLDIPERAACMEALYKGEEFVAATDESVQNILERYRDIETNFPEDLLGDTLPYFVDWLINNVYMVEITAYSDEDAYTIFETMNDRGLSLAPAEMLKGYLLANIKNPEKRDRASCAWRHQVKALRDLERDDLNRDEVADALKAWLRGQYAQSIRERKKGASPGDFDLIGSEFHRWVRDKREELGLVSEEAFTRFIERDFAFYSQWYRRIRKAASARDPELESVYFNAQHEFTLQYPVLLAALKVEDDEATCLAKLRVLSDYLDIVIHRRIWNFRAIDYNTMRGFIFAVMREVRGKSATELADFLCRRLEGEEAFSDKKRFRLHGTNGWRVHLMLARLTDYVETRSGMPSRIEEYLQTRHNRYEIEHIWADHPERHTDEFPHPGDFREYRNHVGGLLLLPKSFNASYGNLPYAEKWPHYVRQNLLASSLCDQTYQHNPGFLQFIKQSGLQDLFRPHPEFKKADLDTRQELYRRLAELVWSPDRLERAALPVQVGTK